MAGSWSIFIGFVVVILASVAAWFFSPKGENQTVWRSTLILSFASCYIMWGMNSTAFLAPIHYTPSSTPKEANCGRNMRRIDMENAKSQAVRSYRGLSGALWTQRI
ncbi:hypothetical protein V491_07394 [Pseudogymnoascus sp. VKM F-3775]|nr:hypothetical protein V491_07394 [Pseudogymnoascus sp. VKM F-3775]